MEIVGRITRDAVVRELQNERNVVSFGIAINESYKSKGSTEAKNFTTFVNCSYWMGTGITPYLKKGTLVEMTGSLTANAFLNSENNPVPSLNFYVRRIKIHGGVRTAAAAKPEENQQLETADDPPF